MHFPFSCLRFLFPYFTSSSPQLPSFRFMSLHFPSFSFVSSHLSLHFPFIPAISKLVMSSNLPSMRTVSLHPSVSFHFPALPLVSLHVLSFPFISTHLLSHPIMLHFLSFCSFMPPPFPNPFVLHCTHALHITSDDASNAGDAVQHRALFFPLCGETHTRMVGGVGRTASWGSVLLLGSLPASFTRVLTWL